MSHRNSFVTAAAVLLSVAGSARATFVSFGSDGDSTHWTFSSAAASGGSFAITSPTVSALTLLIDDDNGAAPTLAIPVRFSANLTATFGSSSPIFPTSSVFNHTYLINGSFTFSNPANPSEAWLTISVGDTSAPTAGPGVLIVPGGASSWGSAGAIIGADQFANITYTATQAFVDAVNAAALIGGNTNSTYGVFAGNSAAPDDFGFDLSVINTGGSTGTIQGPPVQIGTNGLPLSTWRAESSFSGSAVNGIPAPGAVALLGMGMVVAIRRRRA